MSDSDLSIRPLESWDEYLDAEEIQRSVWQMPDWRDSVPANLLITVYKNGGVILGAFDGSKLVGFVFSFVGSDTQNGAMKMKHCSHMLAVLPDYQSRKIGARLKFAQREVVLGQHIDLITWTYDPLQALNANLNLVRLGAIARQYILDAYGEMTDGINAGLGSDRFQVEWWLNAPRVIACAAHPERNETKSWDSLVRSGAQEIFAVTTDARGFPRVENATEPRAETLIAEIPAHIGALKTSAPDLAREWRMRTREFFTRAFATSYTATDFVFATCGNVRRAAYVLTHAPSGTGTSP